MNTPLTFLPIPRESTRRTGVFALHPNQTIQIVSKDPHRLFFTAQELSAEVMAHTQTEWNVSASRSIPESNIAVQLVIIPTAVTHAEGYRLLITPNLIKITGADEAGIFYGVQTLKQIIAQSEVEGLPCLEINDWPDFPARGVMLDISRDKVYHMETLFMLIDELASWKINQVQLYIEHTFAYLGHETVWQDSSPMTPEEILQLDAYCRERFIELVPNQNSLGHMTRWLKHTQYQHLAERTAPFTMPWGEVRSEPFSLAPVLPESLAFISSLYDQLLANFTSGMMNVGCDETFDVGTGKSKAACDEKGVGQVYLDYLLGLYEDLQQRDYTMQFWGDIILQHPDLITNLPTDVIALDWGYDAGHPFDDETQAFQEAEIPYYVCPGTSSWNSIGGRMDNMIANCREAAEAGLKHASFGYLTTDWGDNGHWQQLPISYPGFATGAAFSWCFQKNRDMDLESVLNQVVFKDRSHQMGKIMCDMGNEYNAWGLTLPNGSPIHILLQESSECLKPLEIADPKFIHETMDRLQDCMESLRAVRLERPDASIIKEEMHLTLQLMQHACKRALNVYFDSQNSPSTNKLYEIHEIISKYKRLWLARNRIGGLSESIAHFITLLEDYQNDER